RYARRLADRLRAPWTALHIDTPRLAGMSEEDKDRLARNLRLAEQLGAEITTLPGQNVAQDIVRHATANNFTHIVIGRPTRSRWRELIEGSLTYDLIRNAGDISVHVISGAERDTDTPSTRLKAAPEQKPFQIWPYLISTVYVAGALAVSS
ncbi:MAG: two-component sensor histidine kinase, partial [Mesorhizobium sp.]